MALETIPNEILSRILIFAMKPNEPVHLHHFIDLGRKIHPPDPAYDDYDSDFLFRTLLPARDWWFDQPDVSQKAVLLDWLLINGTYRRFGSSGKRAFFSPKVFVITPAFLRDFEGNRIRSLARADTRMALSLISNVVVLISPRINP